MWYQTVVDSDGEMVGSATMSDEDMVTRLVHVIDAADEIRQRTGTADPHLRARVLADRQRILDGDIPTAVAACAAQTVLDYRNNARALGFGDVVSLGVPDFHHDEEHTTHTATFAATCGPETFTVTVGHVSVPDVVPETFGA